MRHRVEIQKKARRELDALPAESRTRVTHAIDALADEPRPDGVKKLRGRTQWRIRVGEYRIIYSIFDQDRVIMIEQVAPRTSTTYVL